MKSQLFAGSVTAALFSISSSVVLAETLHLDDQVITATRTMQSPVPVSAAVSVITREEIENKQIQSLPQLLKQLPGVSITSNGGRGANTTVNVRGTNDKHLLVLVDGIKIGSATSGSAALQLIPVELIERIELVRGPRSSLYGSDAIGGVLQIFTRRSTERGVKPFASFSAGSRDTMNGTGGVSAVFDRGWYNVAVESEHTDSFNARAFRPAYPKAYEGDNDGYWALSGAMSGGYRFENGLELQANYLRTKGRNKFDSRSTKGTSGFYAYGDVVQEVYGVQGRFSPVEPWLVTLKAGHSEDLGSNYQDDKFYSRFDSRRDTLGWQNEVRVAENQLVTVGFDYQHDRISTSDHYEKDQRDSSAAYGQYEIQLGKYGLQASVRHDRNQQFGSKNTGGLGLSYQLTDNWLTSFSYGTGFRAPTFNDLYYPPSASTAGNPDLKPETSQSYEWGLTGDTDYGVFDVRVYETHIKDLITWAGRSPMRPENVDKARIRGLEMSWKQSWEEWTFNTNATFMSPENRSKTNHRHLLPRRPKRTMNIEVDRAFGDFSIGASSYLSSQRYDSLSNAESTRLAGFGLFDLRTEYRLTPEWRVQAVLENAFDRRYQTAQTYEQPRRTLLFTVRYNAL